MQIIIDLTLLYYDIVIWNDNSKNHVCIIIIKKSMYICIVYYWKKTT